MWLTIGHRIQKSYFENTLKNENLSYVYLFHGPEMIGKKKFSQDLYCAINHRNGLSDTDPDFKFISPKLSKEETKIYIEDIRDIKSFLALKPYYGPYKFVIVDNADRLTEEASNAILKTLEEPPGHTIIILITSRPGFLLSTIRSRCQPIRFLPQTQEEIALYLKSKKISIQDKEFLVRLSSGRLGWVIKILENKELKKAKESIEEFQKILKQGIFERMQYAKKIYEKESYSNLTSNLMSYFKVTENAGLARQLLYLNKIISQPQFNHRLALENFLINL